MIKSKYGIGLLTLMGFLLLLMPVSNALADSVDGFDSYSSGTASTSMPLPWIYSSSSASCWQSIGTPNIPDTGIVTVPNTQQPSVDATTSPPNIFEFNYAPTCSTSAQTASISIKVNASSTTLFLSWYQSVLSVCTSTTTPTCGMPDDVSTKNGLQPSIVTLKLYINGNLEYSNDTSSMTLCQCWNQVLNTVGVPVAAGSTNTIKFQVSTAGYAGGTYSFSLALDTISFTNSNPIVINTASNPNYNIVLQNYPTDEWYNISDYAQSQIAINYTETTPCTTSSIAANPFIIGAGDQNISNVYYKPTLATQGSQCIITSISYPDVYAANLAYASLITVSVGNQIGSTADTQYQRSIIPCLNPLKGILIVDTNTCGQTYGQNGTSYAGVQRVYLEAPNTISEYTISINDLSNIYSQSGTQIYLYSGTSLITSGYIDSQGQFPVALVPGAYTAILVSSDGDEYQTTINAGSTSAIGISIGTIPFTATSNIAPLSIGGGLTCDLTGLIVGYTDNQGLTTSVTFTLDVYNASGVITIGTHTESMSLGATSLYYTFTGINDTIAQNYVLQANSTRTDGAFPFIGPTPVTAQQSGCNTLPSSFPKTPIVPNAVFGLNQILPNPASALELLSFGFILLISLELSVRTAKLGTIFVIGLSIIFTMAGWLPLQTFYASLFMVGAITVFLLSKQRGGT